jgi:hypothetical protein
MIRSRVAQWVFLALAYGWLGGGALRADPFECCYQCDWILEINCPDSDWHCSCRDGVLTACYGTNPACSGS